MAALLIARQHEAHMVDADAIVAISNSRGWCRRWRNLLQSEVIARHVASHSTNQRWPSPQGLDCLVSTHPTLGGRHHSIVSHRAVITALPARAIYLSRLRPECIRENYFPIRNLCTAPWSFRALTLSFNRRDNALPTQPLSSDTGGQTLRRAIFAAGRRERRVEQAEERVRHTDQGRPKGSEVWISAQGKTRHCAIARRRGIDILLRQFAWAPTAENKGVHQSLP